MSQDTLESYTRRYPSYCEFEEAWPIQGRMTVHLGLADRPPPPEVASSVLSIVFDSQNRVLFLWPDEPAGNISHMLVGGRSNEGESSEHTVKRDVGEETAWVVEPRTLIGYRHFHQLKPKISQSDRQHPDFIQQIWVSTAIHFDDCLVIASDRLPYAFLSFGRALERTNLDQRALLRTAAST